MKKELNLLAYNFLFPLMMGLSFYLAFAQTVE